MIKSLHIKTVHKTCTIMGTILLYVIGNLIFVAIYEALT
jgi:hypothetical protein